MSGRPFIACFLLAGIVVSGTSIRSLPLSEASSEQFKGRSSSR